MELMAYIESLKARNIKQAHTKIRMVFLSFTVLALSGCSATSGVLAPKPPKFDKLAAREPITVVDIETAAGGMESQPIAEILEDPALSALEQQKIPASCRVKDRFDRKDVLALEWGGRNRLGFDVGGIGWDSLEVKQVKLRYRLRFQKYKTKKELCRYASGFQGMIGSGYSELFARENNTVWQEIKKMRGDVQDRWGKVF